MFISTPFRMRCQVAFFIGQLVKCGYLFLPLGFGGGVQSPDRRLSRLKGVARASLMVPISRLFPSLPSLNPNKILL